MKLGKVLLLLGCFVLFVSMAVAALPIGGSGRTLSRYESTLAGASTFRAPHALQAAMFGLAASGGGSSLPICPCTKTTVEYGPREGEVTVTTSCVTISRYVGPASEEPTTTAIGPRFGVDWAFFTPSFDSGWSFAGPAEAAGWGSLSGLPELAPVYSTGVF